MPKTDVRKVTPSKPLHLDSQEVALLTELVQFAVEQLTVTLHLAGRRPIARTLERYRDDAASLLERLGA